LTTVVDVTGPTLWERIRRVNPLVWDTLLAAACLAPSLVVGVSEGAVNPAAIALIVVAYGSLVVRRRWPLAVFTTTALATVGYAFVSEGPAIQAALVVAAYTVAAHLPRREVASFAIPLGMVAAISLQLDEDIHTNWVELLVGATFSVLLPILIGRIAFNRRARIAREQELAAADAVAAERTRIARELHDVVAHAIGVMVVQAGAARSVVDRDPAAAKEAIGRVEETGRVGLAEMRRLIGVLTEDGSKAALAPQPGLGYLEELVATMRAAGLPVEVVRAGNTRPLPAGVDLTAYRVIQEALTNVLKHAGRAHAVVSIRYDGNELDLEIADDGLGDVSSTGTGHGLVGMRERVGIFGGRIETGPRPGGGFAVRATIPIDGEVTL
jgi:signal transduction histidine kinase